MDIHFEGLKQDASLLVEVFTQTGKAVFTREMETEEQSGHLIVPVSDLSQGIYSVRITAADTLYTELFIKN